jgi:hypothetical protein
MQRPAHLGVKGWEIIALPGVGGGKGGIIAAAGRLPRV